MASEEVMVAQNQGIGQKITQVAILLQTEKEATITAINMAIPAAINLAELIKHRVKGIHQINTFEKVADSNKTRLKIKLSLNPLNVNDKGYQAPLPSDQVQEKSLDELKKAPVRTWEDRPNARRSRRGRGRGNRGPRGDRADPKEWTEKGETRQGDDNEERSRGRGRGRGLRRPRRSRNLESGQTRGEHDGDSRPRGRFPRGRGGRRSRRAPRSGPQTESAINPPSSINAPDPWKTE